MHIVQTYRQTAKKDHLRILQRRQIIEERKEELENVTVQRVSVTTYGLDRLVSCNVIHEPSIIMC